MNLYIFIAVIKKEESSSVEQLEPTVSVLNSTAGYRPSTYVSDTRTLNLAEISKHVPVVPK